MSIFRIIKLSLVPPNSPPHENLQKPFLFKAVFDSEENFDEHINYCEKLSQVFSVQDWSLSIQFKFYNTSNGLWCNAKMHDISKLLETLHNLMKGEMYATVSLESTNPLHPEKDYLNNYCSRKSKLEKTSGYCEFEIGMRSLKLEEITKYGPWNITVVLSFDPCPIHELKLPSIITTSSSTELSICKKILLEEIATDAIIIPSNGNLVKCHKSFLFAHSTVFETMFQSDMQEGQNSTVEMIDMSEQGVRALLSYLYYWDLTEPSETCAIAFELLNAGHKYDIPELETKIGRIILSKTVNWFDLDIAVKLFAFSRNLPSTTSSNSGIGCQLKKKAVLVMKGNLDKLEQCPAYQDLFKESSQAAMELCRYAFST